jgi:hypothetical protein
MLFADLHHFADNQSFKVEAERARAQSVSYTLRKCLLHLLSFTGVTGFAG